MSTYADVIEGLDLARDIIELRRAMLKVRPDTKKGAVYAKALEAIRLSRFEAELAAKGGI